jgi:protocatechuate 3,4-dioxygenase beta subunit
MHCFDNLTGKHFVIILFVALGIAVSQPARAQITAEDFQELKKVFLLHPADYTHYQSLQMLRGTQYELLSAGQRNEIRQLLNKSTFSKIKNYPTGEPGARIVITGIVSDKNSNPVALAKIIVFQTDASGNYAPQDSKTKRMSESDARLYGVLQTDNEGRYELIAIHPGSYPLKYEGRFIPQHIHFNVSAKGVPVLKLQLAFEDDPVMKDRHWQTWAKDLGYPVVKLVSINGIPTGVCNIMLKK